MPSAFQDNAFQISGFQMEAVSASEVVVPVLYLRSPLRKSFFERKKKWEERLKFEYKLNHPEARIITQVALRQVEDLHQDEVQRTEELYREFLLAELELETRHLQALNEFRERLIEEEIGTRFKQKLDQEEAMLLILLGVALDVVSAH